MPHVSSGEGSSRTKTGTESAGEALLGPCLYPPVPATPSVSPRPQRTELFQFTMATLQPYHRASLAPLLQRHVNDLESGEKSQTVGNTSSNANACLELYTELSKTCFEKKGPVS